MSQDRRSFLQFETNIFHNNNGLFHKLNKWSAQFCLPTLGKCFCVFQDKFLRKRTRVHLHSMNDTIHVCLQTAIFLIKTVYVLMLQF